MNYSNAQKRNCLNINVLPPPPIEGGKEIYFTYFAQFARSIVGLAAIVMSLLNL